MRKQLLLLKRAWLGVAAAAVALFSAGNASADLIIHQFASASEVSAWRYDYGLGSGLQSFTHDVTQDAGGGTPGSMKLVMNFTGAGGHAYTVDTFGTATNLTLAGYTNISFAVKVSPTSPAYGDGSAGYFKLVIRAGDGAYTFLQQYADNLNTNNGWFVINVPITGDVTQTRAFTIEFSDSGLTGTRTVWVDNLILKGGAGGGGGPTCETGLVVNRFNSGSETSTWRLDFGVAGSTLAHVTAQDAGCGTSPGALKLDIPFSASATSGTAFTTDCFTSPGTNPPAGGFTNLTLDVKVDPASPAYGDGSAGWFEVILRTDDGNYTWTPQFGGNLNTNDGWKHLSIPLTGTLTGTRAVTLQFGHSGLNGTRTVYVDNLVFTGGGGGGGGLVVVDPPPTCETGLVLNRFYTQGEVFNWPFDFGRSGSSVTFATNNVACGAFTNRGSAQFTMPFPGGTNSYAFTRQLDSAYTNLAALGYTNIAFDIKVSTASDYYNTGEAGYFQFVMRTGPNWDWNELSGGNLNVTNGWAHFDLPLIVGDLTDVRAFTMQFSASGLTNRIVWLDNVVLKGPAVTEPPLPSPAQCVVNAFNSAAETNGWRQGGGVTNVLRQWSTQDADGNTNSGSLKVTIPFDIGLYGGDNKGQVTKTLWLGGLNVTNQGYTHIAMDVKVDPASALDAFGLNGYFNAAFRADLVDEPAGINTSWLPQIGGNLNTNGWIHFEQAVTGNLTNIWELTLQVWGGSGQNITGPVILYVDNIVLKGATCAGGLPTAPLLSVQRSGGNLLVSYPTESGRTYQLQSRSSLNSGTWSDLGGSVAGNGGLNTNTVPVGNGSQFLRVRVQ